MDLNNVNGNAQIAILSTNIRTYNNKNHYLQEIEFNMNYSFVVPILDVFSFSCATVTFY